MKGEKEGRDELEKRGEGRETSPPVEISGYATERH